MCPVSDEMLWWKVQESQNDFESLRNEIKDFLFQLVLWLIKFLHHYDSTEYRWLIRHHNIQYPKELFLIIAPHAMGLWSTSPSQEPNKHTRVLQIDPFAAQKVEGWLLT